MEAACNTCGKPAAIFNEWGMHCDNCWRLIQEGKIMTPGDRHLAKQIIANAKAAEAAPADTAQE